MFWWVIEQERLSEKALACIADRGTDVYVSTASAWEIAIKVGLGKWPHAVELLEDFEGLPNAERFRLLPIAVSHVRAAGLLSPPHRDPFDRLLASQAMIEGLTLVSADPKIVELGTEVLW